MKYKQYKKKAYLQLMLNLTSQITFYTQMYT